MIILLKSSVWST